jgi:hypothetical protein
MARPERRPLNLMKWKAAIWKSAAPPVPKPGRLSASARN